MVAPLVVQADDSSSYALICTSAGLVKVDTESGSLYKANGSLDNAKGSLYNAKGSFPINASSNLSLDASTVDFNTYDASQAHCVYCNLAEQPAFQATNLAQHSIPNSKIKLFYQRFVEPISSKSLLRYVQLRAPPVYI